MVSRTNTVHAVRGIRLEIEPGELVAAVLGPWGWVAAVVTVAVGLTVGISSMRGSAD